MGQSWSATNGSGGSHEDNRCRYNPELYKPPLITWEEVLLSPFYRGGGERGDVTCLRSHSKPVAEVGLEFETSLDSTLPVPPTHGASQTKRGGIAGHRDCVRADQSGKSITRGPSLATASSFKGR